MASYLVTGGCGFIGSHLCVALLAGGHDVLVLDDLSTGHPDNLAPGAALMVGDIADCHVLHEAMAGVDGCFHLAAIASVERGVRDWTGTHRTNLSGTVAVFEAARRESEARGVSVPVVYASSAAVYGDPASLPAAETTPARPLSAYGADKLGCELHARAGGAVHGLHSVGLRFFNVFGPRQDPRSPYSGVVSIFCGRLARGEPLDIHGDGEQTRDFVHVADVVAALVAALRRAAPDAPVFNVCTGRATSVRDLAMLLGDAWGLTPTLRFGTPRAGEIRHSVGSRTDTAVQLGLADTMPLDRGLIDLSDWFRAGQPRLVSSGPLRVLENAQP
ncbi:NAD-dependent epimerase/dehydratase family protein [Roseomonas terrae]|jgi:UDP-glucose 4-epimerase|uniref:NAD-dependent epimerase/dehydratase family protein n=1 Tax=Neoroseomonas terrae TaxID=424799 RepID=A0ABS5EKD7_9PROT|nr:NAD-dependent epimerase/dehydratase family protein [Neoroseomonas terrae]MBR0651495.1 NAD-dependent epimerase/dehydratase family protein [Neoroseomonas terrae]